MSYNVTIFVFIISYTEMKGVVVTITRQDTFLWLSHLTTKWSKTTTTKNMLTKKKLKTVSWDMCIDQSYPRQSV